MADLEDAESSLSSASASPKGQLRIDVPSPFARLILVPALPTVHARYPDIRLDLGVSDRVVDVIGDNERAGTPSHPRELEDTHHRVLGFL